MDHKPILEVKAALPQINIAHCMNQVRQKYGKGLRSQAMEILSLARSEGRISAAEYYMYRLFDDQRFTKEQKRQFIGKRVEMKLHRVTGNIDYFGCVDDKFLAYQLMESLGFPVPTTVAIYWQRSRLASIPSLSDDRMLAEHLRGGIEYPWFGKPVTGIRSQGTILALDYDSQTDELQLAGGRRVTVDALIEALTPYREDGYLFQRPLKSHGDIEQVCGNRLTTARVIVLLTANGPRILQTLWKIPVGDNIADNFWRSGNLLATIDPEHGTIKRVTTGIGLDHQEISDHPDTGQPLVSFQLPNWEKVIELCLEAAPIHSKLRMQAFDIALTREGPCLMEINIGGDFNLPQLAADQGLLTPGFREFLWHCAKSRKIESVLSKLKIRES